MTVININNILHFKVILSFNGKIKDNPYRIIALTQDSSLYDLGEAIVAAFDFDLDHAFGFYDNIKKPYNSKIGYELFTDIGEDGNFQGVKNTKLSEVFTELKTKIFFLFDYGDEWHFIVQLIKIADFNKNMKYPFIIESFGDAPSQYGDNDDLDEEDF